MKMKKQKAKGKRKKPQRKWNGCEYVLNLILDDYKRGGPLSERIGG